MPLYAFKLEVATFLMYGQPLSNPQAEAAHTVHRRSLQYADNGDPVGQDVSHAVRLDSVGHLPEVAALRARWCKLRGCSKRSTLWCKKCRVYLCIKKDRNCFEVFHTVY